MKATTMTMIKDVLAILLIAGVIFSPSVSDWWIIIGVVLLLAGNYSFPSTSKDSTSKD